MNFSISTKFPPENFYEISAGKFFYKKGVGCFFRRKFFLINECKTGLP